MAPLAQLQLREEVFFLAGEQCNCLSGTRCRQYGLRPLDCRLYPLDLVEEEGELWWCIFEDCRAPEALAAVLLPRITSLEAAMTPEILGHFRAQIRVTRQSWAPYSEGRYQKIRRFSPLQ